MNTNGFDFRKILITFFVVTTCVCAAMAVLGTLFEPTSLHGYDVLFSPLIFGAATTLPIVVNYSKRELSVREAAVRKLIQFVLIELVVFLIAGLPSGAPISISLALSVLLIFVTVHLVLWINDRRIAEEFNGALKEMQERH